MHNEVDKFLLSHKVEIADNGFSDRVMSHLPARADHRNRIEVIWQIVCLVGTLVLCSLTDILDVLITDIKAFIVTLPLESSLNQWLYILGIPLLLYWVVTAMLTHLSIKNNISFNI